jgi:hypothetical protein
MEILNWLAIPSGIALIVKIIALRYAYTAEYSAPFKMMLICLTLQNFIEAYMYADLYNISLAVIEWIVRFHNISSLLCLAFLTQHVSNISHFKHERILQKILTFSGIALTLLIFTDQIIAGITFSTYSPISVRGPWYGVLTAYIFCTIVFIGWQLFTKYLKPVNNDQQIRCLYTLVAMVPLFIIVAIVLILKHLDYPASIAVLVPMASIIFIVSIMYAELSPKATDIRAYFPFSAERKTSRSLFKLCSQYSKRQVSYKEAQVEFEHSLVRYSLIKNNYNILQTAQNMGIDRSTLYSICKKHDIKLRRCPR